jgi:predicted DNA binding CopG/RHH family protein
MSLTAKRPSKGKPAASLDELKAQVQGKTEESTKRLNVNLPESTFKAFKSQAAAEGETMSALVLKWVNEYLSK